MAKPTYKSNEICGKCLHHRRDNEEWVCKNPESECYGDYTEYKDACDEFEERINSGFAASIKKK